jgi:hypothetical protein
MGVDFPSGLGDKVQTGHKNQRGQTEHGVLLGNLSACRRQKLPDVGAEYNLFSWACQDLPVGHGTGRAKTGTYTLSPDTIHHSLANDPDFWRELVASSEYWFEVTSDSMVPTLLPGDRVCVRSQDLPSATGEIIVFLHEGRLVAHRCIGDCRFRGDARLLPDPPVPGGQIVGLAVACRRGDREWPLGKRLPWITRWYRFRLHRRRLDHRLRRFFARLLGRGGAEHGE